MANPAQPPDPWTRAKERFLQDLTPKEQELYESATLENIFYDASAVQKSHSANSTTLRMNSKIQPFVTAVYQYRHAFDVLSNTYSLALAPIWGSLRVLLQIANEFEKYFVKLIDMFARIGDVLPRFRDYERLFPNHERLLQALSVVYLDIMEFCAEAKVVFRQAKHRSVVNSKIALKLAWKPFDKQFGNVIEEFRQHRKTVESEANVASMIEDANSRALELANRLQLEKEKQEKKRLKVLETLLCYNYWDRHANFQYKRYQDSGLWLIEDSRYCKWIESTVSSCLWLYGIPGCGKTILTSKVIDTLSSGLKKVEILVYCYCDYAEAATLKTRTVVMTILHQILKTLQVPEEIEREVEELFIRGHRAPKLDEILSIINGTVSRFSKIYLIIDGFDECQKQDQQDILHIINRLASTETPIFKIFASSRDEPRIANDLDCPRIQVCSDKVHKDIEDFVSGSVQLRLDNGEMTIGSPKLKEEVIAELVAKAHGMFLWVSFQIDDLCEASSDSQIRETIRNLPDGLIETYTRIVNKISNKIRVKIAQRILMWIICAQRPLSADELAEAISIEPLDPSWDAEKMPTDLDHMLASCGNLVVVEQPNKIVRLAHHTVQQFLVVSENEQIKYPIQCRQKEGNEIIGSICVTYLSFSDFETQITAQAPQQTLERSGILSSTGLGQIPRMLGIGSNVFNVAYMLLPKPRGQEPLEIEYRTLSSAVKKSPPPLSLTQKYRLLSYAIKYWTWHTRGPDISWLIFPTNNPLWKAFRSLALTKKTAFEFRKWDTPEKIKGLDFYELFFWAFEMAHIPLLHAASLGVLGSDYRSNIRAYYRQMISMHPVLDKSITVEESEKSPILRACFHNHDSMISFLFSCGIDLPDKELLAAAILGDSLESFRLLINGREHVQLFSGDKTALHLAAEGGHMRILMFLLRAHDTPVSLQDSNGQTALHLAAMNSRTDAFIALFEHETVDTLKNNWGRTVLQIITDCRREDLVCKILIRYINGSQAFRSKIRDDYFGEGIPLLVAVKADCTDMAISIIEKREIIAQGRFSSLRSLESFDINATTSDKESALLLSVANGNYTIASSLLRYGADVNISDIKGRAPLMAAALFIDQKMVDLLEDYKADIAVVDEAGRTALMLAVEERKIGMVKRLLDRGHSKIINTKNKKLQSPLHVISTPSIPYHIYEVDILKVLLENGAKLEERDSRSKTPLLLAASSGNVAVLRELLKNKADTEARDDRGLTPLLATIMGFYVLDERDDPDDTSVISNVRSLIEHGADINAQTTSGATALIITIKERRSDDMISLLLEKGIKVNVKDNTDQTALDYAIQEGRDGAIILLIEYGAVAKSRIPKRFSNINRVKKSPRIVVSDDDMASD